MSAGAIALDEIQSADWSLALDTSMGGALQAVVPGAGLGKVVQGIADINQCIGIILSTPPGSDPLRPTFACDLWRLIDTPITVARPQLVREIVEGITKWEPRVRVLSVVVNVEGGINSAILLANLLITIVWQLLIDVSGVGNQTLTITVPSSLA
jgi:phage baseplate assembly protein W